MSDFPRPLITLSDAIADIVARHAPSVVAIHTRRSRTSGFVWRNGLVVTADEPLPDDETIEVAFADGAVATATLAGRDPSTDVVLLRMDHAGAQPVVAAEQPARPGAIVIALGAHDATPIAAFGIVAVAGGAWNSLRGGRIDARLEIDASIRASSEGGVALDARGGALGMVVFGPRRRGLVIPMATIERIATRLDTHGRVARGYLGVGLDRVRLDDGTRAAMVMSVNANGPAAGAGVRQGDVLVTWDGEPVGGVHGVHQRLGSESVGHAVRLGLRRGGEPMEITVTIAERPES